MTPSPDDDFAIVIDIITVWENYCCAVGSADGIAKCHNAKEAIKQIRMRQERLNAIDQYFAKYYGPEAVASLLKDGFKIIPPGKIEGEK